MEIIHFVGWNEKLDLIGSKQSGGWNGIYQFPSPSIVLSFFSSPFFVQDLLHFQPCSSLQSHLNCFLGSCSWTNIITPLQLLHLSRASFGNRTNSLYIQDLTNLPKKVMFQPKTQTFKVFISTMRPRCLSPLFQPGGERSPASGQRSESCSRKFTFLPLSSHINPPQPPCPPPHPNKQDVKYQNLCGK